MKLNKKYIKSSWSFILIVVGFIFIAELTEEWISPMLQAFIKLDHLNAILWIALSAPLIWWFVKYRNRYQEELLENEERFRSVIQTANDAIILADKNGSIVSWNNSAQKMFGYESSEILGKSLSILIPEQYYVDHGKILESYNSKEELKVIGRTFEAPGRKKDGSIFPLEFSVSTWSTKHGRFFTGIFRDITSRKQAEDLLRKSKEFTETVLNNLDDTISVIDVRDFRIIDVNQVFLEKYKVKKEEVIGKYCHEIIHKSAKQCLPPDDICPLLDTVNTGKITTVEHIHYMNDGEKRYVTVSTSPIKDESGKVINVIHVVRDITRNKQIEESLAKSEMKYRTLFEDAGDYILVISLLDPNRPVIIDANISALKHHGYTREEMIGKAIWELDAPGIFEKNIEIVHQMKKPGDSCFFETVHIRKDGSTFQAEVLARLLQIGIEPPFLLSIERDITERKSAQVKIESSLKEKEILLKEIHHRVKNNMQVISSLLGLASETITDKKYADMFRESQDRINSMSLVHENLYQSADLARIDFNDYIKDLTSGLFQSHGVNASTIKLKLDIENVSLGIDLAIPCGLIINELITNSIKHAFPNRRKGEIRVSARNKDENIIEIVVSDDGVGIPSDLDFRNTKSLGLHLVTILAQGQLNGKIYLDRSRGTEFKIIFFAEK